MPIRSGITVMRPSGPMGSVNVPDMAAALSAARLATALARARASGPAARSVVVGIFDTTRCSALEIKPGWGGGLKFDMVGNVLGYQLRRQSRAGQNGSRPHPGQNT